jgi:hypothetical protein
MAFESTASLHNPLIVHFSHSGCVLRQLDPLHLEIWGNDISEHYLVCYDEAQPHLLDVFYIPLDTPVERHDGMG